MFHIFLSLLALYSLLMLRCFFMIRHSRSFIVLRTFNECIRVVVTRIYVFSHFTQHLHFMPSEGQTFSHVKSFFLVWNVLTFGKEDMFLAQSLNNERIAQFLVFSRRKTLHHRFDKSSSYFGGKLKRRRETDMQKEIEAKQ